VGGWQCEADTKFRARDPEKVAKQKEETNSLANNFKGPAATPKADDTWNSFCAWRTKERRTVYPGQGQAVYFAISAREWRKRGA